MRCGNHPGTHTDDLCDFCAQPYCSQCIISHQQWRHCSSCYERRLREGKITDQPIVPHQAGHVVDLALFAWMVSVADVVRFGWVYQLIGIGWLFAVIAIAKARKVREEIASDRTLTGLQTVNRAMRFAWLLLFVWLCGSVVLMSLAWPNMIGPDTP